MLEGVVPFPPDFAARYRAKGYWEDRSLRDEFAAVFQKYGPRVCIIDRDRQITYAELDRLSTNLALNLLELGFKPLDRVVPTLPNVAEFVILYFALQKIGCIPIAALVTHRYSEISQFVRLSQAVACIYPERQSDFEFAPMVRRVREENPCCKFAITTGKPGPDELSLQALIETPAKLPASELTKLKLEPTDPCIFQLSGGTTGIPKLIPRTHNDYAYNSKQASKVCEVGGNSVLLLMLPIAHNLPLACPGIQGFMFNGGKIVLSQTTRPEEIFPTIAKHKVSHIKVVPALLIRLINSADVTKHDTSSVKYIQSGGQRLQPEVRIKTKELIPSTFVQENFGMSEGMLMFAKIDDPEPVRMETVGFPICPDDEVLLLDEEDNIVAKGEVGEFCARGPYTLRGYYGTPEHNLRAFTPDGFYRSGDLMRQHPSGAYMVEGRKKDVINRGGEKISAEEVENLILSHPAVQNAACIAVPDADMGERMCACVILNPGKTLTLKELVDYLQTKEIAKYKLPERLEIMDDFPLSKFGKVAKNVMVEMVSAKMQKK